MLFKHRFIGKRKYSVKKNTFTTNTLITRAGLIALFPSIDNVSYCTF